MNTNGLKVAFITPEFVTEDSGCGGLSTYLARMTRVLVDQGHFPEVFVPNDRQPGDIDFHGVQVHRVRSANHRIAMRLIWRLRSFLPSRSAGAVVSALSSAWGLASALGAHEGQRPFDIVQSADLLGAGLFVKRRPQRRHLVRCSRAEDLCSQHEDYVSNAQGWLTKLAHISIQRADVAYAPSQYVASHYRRLLGIDVQVLRPPMPSAAESGPLSIELPVRYFTHFGKLGPLKGTTVLAEALKEVWQREPDFTMVWAGRCAPTYLQDLGELWGANRSKVVYAGVLTRSQVAWLVRQAEAAVLPSLVDNLPNTVIESLASGIPVIGSAGASIDELVEPGVTGELVPIGNSSALADAIVKVWRGESGAVRGFRWNSGVAESMLPENAVQSLFSLAAGSSVLRGLTNRETAPGRVASSFL